MSKVCTKCGTEKDPGEFGSHPNGKNRKQSQCRACVAARVRLWRAANPEKKKARSQAWRNANPEKAAAAHRRQRLALYGLTPADYDRMFAEQGGSCAICGSGPESERNHNKPSLSVDHDHGTGRVRGLLCQTCNRSIGQIGDANLAAAADYIGGVA